MTRDKKVERKESYRNDGILDESDRSFLHKVLDDINEVEDRPQKKKEESFHSKMFKKKYISKRLGRELYKDDQLRVASFKNKATRPGSISTKIADFRKNLKTVGHVASKSTWGSQFKARLAEKDEYSLSKNQKLNKSKNSMNPQAKKFEEQDFLLYQQEKTPAKLRSTHRLDGQSDPSQFYKKRGSLIGQAEPVKRLNTGNTNGRRVSNQNQLFDLRKLWTAEEVNGSLKSKRKGKKKKKPKKKKEKDLSNEDSDQESKIEDSLRSESEDDDEDSENVEDEFRKRNLSHFGQSHKGVKKGSSIAKRHGTKKSNRKFEMNSRKRRKSRKVTQKRPQLDSKREGSAQKELLYSVDSDSEEESDQESKFFHLIFWLVVLEIFC